MSRIREQLSQYWENIQDNLFPWLREELGELTENHQRLITTLEVLRIEEHVPGSWGWPGRPPAERGALARAFVAKAVYNLSTTRMLIDRLMCDKTLRRICGWERQSDIPSESTFSRAFAEFAEGKLAERVHEALIGRTQGERLVGHISRDSTEIDAREKPAPKQAPEKPKKKRKPGRPKKGEE
ncbi:MAG: transposase, partial [Planctomycetes bacterium]|nr:transposase [Planctomycetota bacterium]